MGRRVVTMPVPPVAFGSRAWKQVVIAQASLDQQKAARLINKAIKALEEGLEASKIRIVIEKGRPAEKIEEVDYKTRVIAARTLFECLGVFPSVKADQVGSVPPKWRAKIKEIQVDGDGTADLSSEAMGDATIDVEATPDGEDDESA